VLQLLKASSNKRTTLVAKKNHMQNTVCMDSHSKQKLDVHSIAVAKFQKCSIVCKLIRENSHDWFVVETSKKGDTEGC
jgi:hypothetical protein